MRLTVSTLPGRAVKLRVEKTDGNGTPVAVFTSPFTDLPADYNKGSKALGVPYAILFDLIEVRYRRNAADNSVDLATARPAVVFSVRDEGSSYTNTAADFAGALALCKGNSLIEWGSTEVVCCLDIDHHTEDTPAPTHELMALCETIRPAPLHFWPSKRGGVHLIFEMHGDYTAEDMAAVAAYQFAQRFPLLGYEFLHRTRQPQQDHRTRAADYDAGAIRKLLGEYVAGDFADWLEQHGFKVGGRYPHTQCPAEAYAASEGNSNPVQVHEDHIFCFHCEAKGRCKGSEKPGYFPLAALAGERTETAVARCVNNFVHWGHARHIVSNALPPQIAERVYRALLRARHGSSDERVPAIFTACKENGLVRYSGYWADNEGKLITLGAGSAILKSLPHCKYIDAAGELQTAADRVEWLAQPINHSLRGYTPVFPVRGIQFTQLQTLPNDKVYTVLPSERLAPSNLAGRRPRYLDSKRRMSLQAAWDVLREPFPGIDAKLIELLLVGRGCYEHRAGLPPMVFLTGVTGSGKTAHVHAAAAIAGDSVAVVPYTDNTERLQQGVRHGKQSGAFIMFDEFFKESRKRRVADASAMESLLSFTPESTSHELYIGSVPMGDLPFFIWADVGVPADVKRHEQIGRRMFYYHLAEGEKDWEVSLRDSGVNDPRDLRVNGSEEMVKACDSIVSHIIDTHFTCPATDFAQVAESLGFQKLRECNDVKDKHGMLNELFDAVCTAPARPHTNRRFKAQAKQFRAEPTDPIYAALEGLWLEDEKNTAKCRTLEETDLKRVLNLKRQAKCEIRQHGSTFAILFTSLDETVFNEGLKHD